MEAGCCYKQAFVYLVYEMLYCQWFKCLRYNFHLLTSWSKVSWKRCLVNGLGVCATTFTCCLRGQRCL